METHAYEAAGIAAATRSTLVAQRRSFIAETVFSHPSKLDLITAAHAAQYTVVLHVFMVTEDLSVERVRHRVIAGGHSVPEDKIRGRHRRLWDLVERAMTLSDTATVYDNSRREGPRIVAQFVGRDIVGAPSWPEWTPSTFASRWPA